ncbi:MAG TPA: TIGR00282 family metallophosphoesterase, partial [Ignavibacteriaceae bacterium]|nr:TIGR00282 family metallophosphoesterase [Ignavibacteriaceae bacterium]
QGRTFMSPLDCPFRSADWALQRIKSETKVVILDFHAEATAEKMAMGHYLDGKISALIGTHTHTQTADERILAGGTAFITDVGMSGPYDSVIGMKTVAAINRFLYQTPQKYETASDNVHLAGVFLVVNTETGKSTSIERIFFPEFDRSV